uniref:Uncharacterized protein n=1 Tax=viral metagenome TaxID=1070528 RepID=A0A6C0C757_9ZZZZ
MSITTLHNFKFTNGHIFEIKFTDLPDTASKQHRFQWIMLLNDCRYDLSFLNMTPTTRKFKFTYGTVDLDFDNKSLKIQYEDNGEIISYPITENL